ncbi:hypothetical protein NA56DRAFT_700274 [Hyaloscypha hepaticicola]|uniref:Uncharacterized protein n=1 Tax=Hyaloscypha hepaticicola TaxID=2082293 RepID=A0A2J6QEE2_9HELO|nr:hypothetical protein NA56DRAFT_700274 [Hyaloscypha hepaticicola]
MHAAPKLLRYLRPWKGVYLLLLAGAGDTFAFSTNPAVYSVSSFFYKPSPLRARVLQSLAITALFMFSFSRVIEVGASLDTNSSASPRLRPLGNHQLQAQAV